MAQTEGDLLTNWNPMAQHFYDDNLNNYENSREDHALEKAKRDRSTKQMKYPYLVVKKDNKLITDLLLRNFFGDDLINDIEYRVTSRVFFVYFHNLCSLEAAWTKIRRFPNIVKCIEGRAKQNLTSYPLSTKEDNVSPAPTPKQEDDNVIDLDARTIQVSVGNQKHPQFFRSPIVVKSDYTAKDSLLLKNDSNTRYLNVKYEFTLERHGAYVQQEDLVADQAVIHYRSGRLIVTPKKQMEFKESAEDLKLAQIAKRCSSCSCFTDNSCRFCSMPFCNPVCFDALSAVHKQTCDKGKPPVVDAGTLQKYTKLKLPPSGSNVKITAFEQTNVLYVRSAEVAAEVAYYKVLSEVMMQGKSSPRLTQLPQLGQLVILQLCSQTVRAMILNVDNPEAIYVVCVDFGSVEITKLEELHECNAYLAALPRYAMPVLLRGVPKRYMCPNLREMMYQLDHNYTFVMKYSQREYDFNKGMQRVLLVENELNRSLNRLLKTILTPVEPTMSEPGLKEDYLQHVPVQTGKRKDLIIMDNTFIKFGVIHCTMLDFAYEITQMQRDLQHYGQNVAKYDFYAPPKNDLCIAKYQDMWCRGLCMELVGDGHPSILFIDYGNIVPIHVDNIRPYPPQFTFPILTTEFDLIGLPDNPTEEYLARLEQHLAVGSTVTCDEVIYNEEDNNYSLRIAAVQQLLN